MISNNEHIETRDNLIDLYYREYPDKYYKTLPEFIVKKLSLPENILANLSNNINNRTREEIKSWMQYSGITLEELNWVGW